MRSCGTLAALAVTGLTGGVGVVTRVIVDPSLEIVARAGDVPARPTYCSKLRPESQELSWRCWPFQEKNALDTKNEVLEFFSV
jgi:hypothetical protein